MSEPRRWLDGDAPAGVRELMEQAQVPRPLSEQARSRSRSRVAALSTLPMVAGFMLWLPQVALGAVLGVAGTGLVVMVTERLKVLPVHAPARAVSAKLAPRPAPVVAVTPPVAPPDSGPVPAPAVAPVRSAAHSASPSVEEAVAPLPINALDREIALLEQARRQLATSPTTALSLLHRHETEFPSGQLRIEREFLIIDALVRSGNRAAAEARAQSLEAQAPRSLYGERLKRILDRSGSE